MGPDPIGQEVIRVQTHTGGRAHGDRGRTWPCMSHVERPQKVTTLPTS